MGHGKVCLGDWGEGIAPPDLYFSHEYHKVSSYLEADFSKLVLLEWQDHDGEIYLPLLLREIPGQGLFDATNAYGYGGPWTVGRPNFTDFRRFFDDWAQENRVVATFLQLHPLYDFSAQFAEVFPLQKTSQAVLWNLGTDDLVAQMSSSHRRNWRRAIKSGLETRVITNPSDLSSFRELYELSMRRLNARSFYFFPDAYWNGLQEQLRDNLVQVDAVFEGRSVASMLCLVTHDCVHFHLNGATDEGREMRGPFVAHVGAAQWGQSQGYEVGNLGVTSEGSLFDFKDRFDPATPSRDFYTTQLIHDLPTFRRLAEGLPETRFFPPWRDPKIAAISTAG